jgi:CDP-glucose 4,6-dehydratase
MRAFTQRVPLVVRNPASVRPFQHVLEPLDGYLLLAERLYAEPRRFSGAWNLGPDEKDAAPVSAVADLLVKAWGEASWLEAPRDPAAPHEAKLLSLDSSKAKRELGWRPRLSIEDAVGLTVEWHKNLLKAADKGCWELTCEQIQRYEALKEARLTA